MLHRDQLLHDPDLLAMVESSTTFRWIGPRRHIIVSIGLSVLSFIHSLGISYL